MANLLPTPAWIILTTISGIASLILFGESHDSKSKIILGTALIALIVHIISFICIWHSPNCIERTYIKINNEYVQEYVQRCVKSEIRTYIQNLPKSVIYDILNENKTKK